MKTSFFAGLCISVCLVATALAGPRDAEWNNVKRALADHLPRTAVETLQPILNAAMAEQAYAEAVKAMAYRIVLESRIAGGQPEEKIKRLQAELDKVPAAMKPPLQAILAHGYWDFFKQNRWRFLQRTQAGTASGADFQTWDLARILAEIDTHFTAALSDETRLKDTPISAYDDLLEKGDVPDAYRPTLFDFFAHEALQFYEAGEQGAVRREDAFELDPTTVPIFADAAELMRWKPSASAVDSPIAKAVLLYGKLLQFHQLDADPSAYLDVDLARLVFGKNHAVGDNVAPLYKAALQRLINRTEGHEVQVRSLAALAKQLYEEGDYVQAHALARRGYTAMPETAGGRLCFNFIELIQAKSAELVTERVWSSPRPTLDVTYRNVRAVYFRAVRIPYADVLAGTHWAYNGLDEEERERLLAKAPTLAWHAELPPTSDFKLRTERLSAPTSLPSGFYVVFASHKPTFEGSANQISMAQVWVSELALVVQQSQKKGEDVRGFVLRADSGEPVNQATVRAYQPNRDGRLVPAGRVETDANGEFRVSLREGPFILLAEHGRDAVASTSAYQGRGGNDGQPDSARTVFFTDRALYRPGQTVYYKGICIRGDKTGKNYSVLAGRDVVVVFQDANGKEVTRAAHKTNDYGSFHGEFTAPRDRLLGHMALRVADGPGGDAGIRVEEYKRPKFQVQLETPANAPHLDGPVVLSGKAVAYTGAPLGGAKVRWSVRRAAQLPYWCWWWRPEPVKAIAHGASVTRDDGTFEITFTAAPDRLVPEKNEPVFEFTVQADVTDLTGETRSHERRVRVGYAALRATVSADEWQVAGSPVQLTVEAASLDGEPQRAKGQLSVYALRQPARVERGPLVSGHHHGWRGVAEPPADASNPETWELGDGVAHETFETAEKGTALVSRSLPTGIYRAVVELKDSSGKTVTARRIVQVIDPKDTHYRVKLAQHLASKNWSVEPGGDFVALWGTGYEKGRAFVEIERDGKPIKRFWTPRNRTQTLVELPITEEMRGGVTLRITYVRENRAYLETRTIQVPWSNKQLSLKWETFRSKLSPGQKEVWSAVITAPDAQRVAAEMVASLYDASLDPFVVHAWPHALHEFRYEHSAWWSTFQNGQLGFQILDRDWDPLPQPVSWNYRSFPAEITTQAHDHPVMLGQGGAVELSSFVVAADKPTSARAMLAAPHEGRAAAPRMKNEADAVPPPPSAPDLSQVSARRNLNETAFFFPQLRAGKDGVVKLEFTMPEALTEWKFQGFAHDRQLRAAYLTDKVVTTKDLMVEPNPPRFVREGDLIEFSVKVTNRADAPQTGQLRLTFADAESLKPVDDALENRPIDRAFDVPARQSRTYAWRIQVPDGIGFLTYKAVGATATLSDGEEGYLPVLSRKILVTESLPLAIRGQGDREFAFHKLLASAGSNTLRHQSLTVQMTSHPAWYAVLALPYLMEFPHECNEQVFNRFYANVLARHIANSDTRIRRVFDAWKTTPALDSPLTKNEEIKSIALQETPWVRQAGQEGEARRNVGLLFDAQRLDAEAARTASQLAEAQQGDGLWPWFPGGRSNQYISLYIATGFGRLRHLGAPVNAQPAITAFAALDRWIHERHREIQKQPQPEAYVPDATEALYLYGRSFFLQDRPVAPEHREAVEFFLAQARKHALTLGLRQGQAHLAIALQRFGDHETPQRIVRSLRERAQVDDEFGMYWRDQERSGWWYHAPIETHALMIELFDEVAKDPAAVEACKVWLLKQKQTQNWTTTKATADAVYALLLRGQSGLVQDTRVEVKLGGKAVEPGKVEAGTGYFEQTYRAPEIRPEMGKIRVKKLEDGVSWGGVFWQYFEDVGKVSAHDGTPLAVKKTLFIKETSSQGPVLKPLSGGVAVGDELVVRLELRADRDMEYVHMKDQRGSGSEPVDVLSRYHYQDGLGYYRSSRDTATHLFIDYLPKGVYVVEYSLRVQHRGRYQAGIAEVQCMYAPEFNSHSESVELVVGGKSE